MYFDFPFVPSSAQLHKVLKDGPPTTFSILAPQSSPDCLTNDALIN